MSRRINLTRIHAISWYGYRDALDVHGNLLVAGITGSGKSVLMDLIQLVLLGDDRLAHYNQSATGAASTRTLKGYCLGDTKQDIDGAAQYMRPRGSITYVALEFTWPDRKRAETWGLRISYDSATREHPNRKNGFVIPASLSRDEFLDADKKPLDWPAFRQLVEQHNGRIFERLENYRTDMALPTHLNFDRATVDHLLPTAMSFSFLPSFNKFCRQYILPVDAVDIQHVRDSYLAFLNLERGLAVLRDQLQRLENIQSLDRQHADAARDRIVTRYLEAECRRDDARENLRRVEQRCAQLEQELAGESTRLKELERDIAAASRESETLKTLLRETEDGRLFLHLKEENKKLVAQIARLKELDATVEQAIQARCSGARSWFDQVRALPVTVEPALLKAGEHALKQLASARGTAITPRVRALAEAVRGILAGIRTATESHVERARQLRHEQEQLQQALAVLELGKPPENTRLLDALNANLPRRGRELPAQALWQLCEVTDERWRPAIEVAFSRKFAVVVRPEDYDAAEKIYHTLREETRGESLINPEQALKLSQECQPGSLAEKIEASHPVARAVVDHLFGNLACVEKLADLRKHPRAILPDGFMASRPFVERPRQYNNRPCIGRRGIEKHKAYLQEQLNANRSAQKQLAPVLDAVRELQDMARDRRLETESVHDDLAEAARLPDVEQQLQDNLHKLRQVRDTGMEEKETRLAKLDGELARWRDEEKQLLKSPKRHQLQELQAQRDRNREKAERAEWDFKTVATEQDVSVHLKRLDQLREEIAQQYPVKEAAADQCRERFHAADKQVAQLRQTVVDQRRELAMAHAVFADFDPQTETNAAYDQRLEKIQAGDIPAYQEKARREQLNWQHLFRTQVLEKLRAALVDAESLIALLNQQLKTPIGNNRYQIVRRANPDHEYDLYRRLLDAAVLAKDDELFFASLDAEVRETVEQLFKNLIEQPDSKEALAFLDYRNYHDYDMEVTDIHDPQARPSSVERHSGKFSGGENQSPYFIAILACYLRAFRRYERRRRDPSLALVPIDEAFSKLSGERIRDCLDAMQKLDLQGVFSMSSGNIPYAIDLCDQVISIAKQEHTTGGMTHIRNIAVSLTREEALKRYRLKG